MRPELGGQADTPKSLNRRDWPMRDLHCVGFADCEDNLTNPVFSAVGRDWRDARHGARPRRLGLRFTRIQNKRSRSPLLNLKINERQPLTSADAYFRGSAGYFLSLAHAPMHLKLTTRFHHNCLMVSLLFAKLAPPTRWRSQAHS
jgi:hypothetical protein